MDVVEHTSLKEGLTSLDDWNIYTTYFPHLGQNIPPHLTKCKRKYILKSLLCFSASSCGNHQPPWWLMVDGSLFDGWWVWWLPPYPAGSSSSPQPWGCWTKIQGTQWFHVHYTGELLPKDIILVLLRIQNQIKCICAAASSRHSMIIVFKFKHCLCQLILATSTGKR